MTILASPVPTAEQIPVTFTVFGDPVPQGSMKGFQRGGKTVLVSDNDDLAPWRRQVTLKAREAWFAHARRSGPLLGGVRLDLVFAIAQRKTAPKNWRTNPDWNIPITRSSGDWDKIARAVSDSLTDAGVYRDDSQVIEGEVFQHYADGPGCPLNLPGVQITVSRVIR